MALSAPSPKSSSHSNLDTNPYVGLATVGIGMTGFILKLDEDRVVKIAKVYPWTITPGTTAAIWNILMTSTAKI